MSWFPRIGRRVAVLGATALTVSFLPLVVQPASADVTLDRDANMESCNGVAPTPGSENTLKDITGGDLQPGGTVTFEVSYPSAGFETGDFFQLTDCFGVVDAKGDMTLELDKFQITFVPNGNDFSFEYDLVIPDSVAVGTQVCNWVKTTEGPSKSPASNRKGDVCFNVGGTLRVEKRDVNTGDPVYGAKFSVECEDDPAVLPTATVGGLQDANGDPIDGNPVTGWLNEVDGITNAIAISGEEGAECTVTELAAPPGYVLPLDPDDRVHTYTIPRVGTTGSIQVIDNEPVPPDYDDIAVSTSPAGSYDVPTSWTLSKSVDDDAHSGVAGQTAGTSTWTVDAVKTVGAPTGFVLSGQTATLTNSNPIPVGATVGVTVGGAAATVDCDAVTPGNQTAVVIPAASGGTDGTASCSYTGTPTSTSDQVVVTATSTTPFVGDGGTSSAIAWTINQTGPQSLGVDDTRAPADVLPATVSATDSWSYPETFSCPTDGSLYDNGVYERTETNTASAAGLPDATASVTVTCVVPDALVVTTAPDGTYDREASWSLTKTVDDSEHDGVAGRDAGTSQWTVTATKTVGDPKNFSVLGQTLTVTNPNAFPVDATVGVTVGGVAATVDCDPATDGDQDGLTVPATGTADCTYSGAAAGTGDQVVVTVTPMTALVDGDTATEDVTWTEIPTGPQSLEVDDSRPGSPLPATVSETTSWSYEETFSCTSEVGEYTGGELSYQAVNTATADGVDDATATVTVNCVLPDALEVSTAPAGSYDVVADWTLDKTVDDAEHAGNAGSDAGTSTWTVTATRTDGAPTNHTVTDQVATVTNTNAFDVDATVAVTIGGVAAAVDCDPATEGDQDDVVVPANGTADCSYSGTATSTEDEVVVTVTSSTLLVDGDTATEAVDWTAVPVGPQSLTVSDDRAPEGTFPATVEQTTSWDYEETFPCSDDAADYDEQRQLTYTVENTATSDVEGVGPATATVTVDCTLPPNGLSVTKAVTADEVVTPGDTLTYTLTVTATGERGETDVVVSDYVPGSDPERPESGKTTYVADSAACDDLGPCVVDVDAETGLITWSLGDFEPGDVRTVTFDVTVDQAGAGAAVDDVLNAAAVESNETPSTPSNEVRTPVTVVLPTQTTSPSPSATPRVLPFVDTPRALPFTGAWLLPTLALGLGAALIGALLLGAGRRREQE